MSAPTRTDPARTDGTRLPERPAAPAGRAGIARWAADLVMGARFAVTGGREGWTRTVLTAVGVGLGVALLLGASAVPDLLPARQARGDARTSDNFGDELKPGPDTLLTAQGNTTYHGDDIAGTLVQPDGPKAPVPPGVSELPGPGEMVVSPALAKLLDSPDGKLLADRLDDRVVGTIADQGLLGPDELIYYAGSDSLDTTDRSVRIDHWGSTSEPEKLDPVLMLLVSIGCVVLLMPVAIFIATAVRFGGERRDRRLAALRLVGADSHMTRRIAAGEALLGSLLGLVTGLGLFLLLRQFIGSITLWDISVFPSDVQPSPALAALIALAVPASAVVVTLLALRGIAIEPLGVVRNATLRRRRLWWRLLMPAAGLALLLPMTGALVAPGTWGPYRVATGAALLLLGVTTVLPWLVEAVVNRFGAGPVAWQLATRRLQLSSGAAARAVSGITVAVAGAIAIQMLFTGVQGDFTKSTGQDTDRAQLQTSVEVRNGEEARSVLEKFRSAKGVSGMVGLTEASVARTTGGKNPDEAPIDTLTIGDCATLRELAVIRGCKDGSVFLVPDPYADGHSPTARPGSKVDLHLDEEGMPTDKPRLWTVPASARKVAPKSDATGMQRSGILATPSTVDVSQLESARAVSMLRLDPAEPEAAELVRNTAADIDPTVDVMALENTSESRKFASIRRGLFIGATGTLLLIGASMVVSTLEQLRERKRLLSVLIAFGTRRSTLSWSVLWQTAVPVALGLGLAVVGGLGLGAALQNMVDRPVAADWTNLMTMTGIGAGVILLVTALSMPPLWRMMRPDGLRTE
ncbi:FtsX-like permease family protein [Streptomyces sp. NPDC004647]|uniref:FtsX-like permease family protein n=1 Tax=Streptomyces sp. NPDC004647 TaxID=3154671 RepID=UPI0033B60765